MFDKPPMRLRGGMEADGEIIKKRPVSETHLAHRPDRVSKYLIHRMDELVFDEFTPAFLVRAGIEDKFNGVPIPLRKDDLEAFKTPGGVQSPILAENMARVLGIDPKFPHREVYVEFIEHNFGKKAVENMTRKAKDFADKEEYEDACIYFRAGLVLKFDDVAALYGYARILRQMYTDGKDEQYIGYLKAECLDFFELTTEAFPRFDMGWYYLGYMYLNMGLYTKAYLAWKEYLPFSRVQKDRREIKKRMAQIEDPMEIERGYNAILSGRWSKGLKILEPYKESKFNDWWPLWYYLGVGYARSENMNEAEKAFKEALKGNPRHVESMEELMDIYKAKGDKTNLKKYRDKIALVTKS